MPSFMTLEPNKTPLSSVRDDPRIPTTIASSWLLILNPFEKYLTSYISKRCSLDSPKTHHQQLHYMVFSISLAPY